MVPQNKDIPQLYLSALLDVQLIENLNKKYHFSKSFDDHIFINHKNFTDYSTNENEVNQWS